MSHLRSSSAGRALSWLAAAIGAATLIGVAGPMPAAAAANGAGQHLLAPRPGGAQPAVIGGKLINHGGPVQSAPRVFVDFWGWPSDPSGEQTYLTNFLSSVGGTAWLGTVGEYGGGSAADLLGGTWSDPAAVPSSPTDAQIQHEAATAAAHFGTGNSVNVQIVVATPTGHSTPGFGSQFCAYPGAVAATPNITYTDLPYIADAGSACGADTVNGGSGRLDGVSIVEGHELAESITDPLINAWLDAGGNEIGDKCAWTNLANITTSAGSFAVQPLWSNDANNCVLPQGGGGQLPTALRNGSFEGTSAGWQTSTAAGGTTNIALYDTHNNAPATAHDGSGYLAVNTNAGGGSVYQDVTVDPNGTTAYTATAWLSSQSGSASGQLCVWGLGPNTDSCRQYTVTAGTYTPVQVVYDLTGPVSTLRFQIYPTPNGGTTDIDTASLQESLVKSGSFESGDSGWSTSAPNAGGTTNIALYDVTKGAPATAHDGIGYLAFNTDGVGGSAYQDVPAPVSTGSYTLTAWLSSQSGSASGYLCLWGLGPNTDSCRQYAVTPGTYTAVQVVYDVTQPVTALRAQVYPTPNGGTTDLDTVSMVRSFVESGSFESSSAGWATMGTSTNIARYDTRDNAPAAAQDGFGYLAFNTAENAGSVYQDVSLVPQPGEATVATAWLSAQSGSASGNVCLWGLGTNTGNCVPYDVTAAGFTPIQLAYDAPRGVTAIRVQIYPTPNGGTTDLDTISLH